MKNAENKTISIPLEVPNINTLNELESILESKKMQLEELKDTLKMFIWCTDPSKIKPSDVQTFNWVDNNIDNLIGRQNNIGNLEIQIYILEQWKKNWNTITKVIGFTMQDVSTIEKPVKKSTKKIPNKQHENTNKH